VVGDILLDVVVRLDGLIQPDTDTYGHAVVGAGGQAANVAAWIVALGGSAALVGRHLIRQELRRRGVILHSPPAARSGAAPAHPAAAWAARYLLSGQRPWPPQPQVTWLQPPARRRGRPAAGLHHLQPLAVLGDGQPDLHP
jgi:hypothetical protein